MERPCKESEQCLEHCKSVGSFYRMMWGSDLVFTDIRSGQTLRLVQLPAEPPK